MCPFLHIGSERQLFLDNFILDHLDGVSREICAPTKTAEPLLAWSDLPWEQVQFNPGTAGVVHDPDDGLFKMWYWQGLTGHAFNEGQVLCYAESKDALQWEKPLRDDCLPFEGHKATNIVHPDVSQSGLALNHDRSDPDRKYLLVNWPPKAARVRPPDSPRLSRVDASPDGIRWHTISEESAFPHHHEQKIFWDGSIRRWVGFSQYSHHQNFLYRKRQIGRQESADFINWSPKEVALSADWDANLPPDLEMHDMSARKVGGLYIGITSEFMAEPFWQERDGHNWRDQAFRPPGPLHQPRRKALAPRRRPRSLGRHRQSGRPGLRFRLLHPRRDARTRRPHGHPLQRQSAKAELAAARASDSALSPRRVCASAASLEGARGDSGRA